MKIALVYPPITKNKKYPLLSQNRHFRYSSSLEVRIFPLVWASAATLLKTKGYDVFYLDGINERLSMNEFMKALEGYNPDVVVLETKTPIVNEHWNFINKVKEEKKHWKFVLVGDHVSCFPKESIENSNVDFVIKGGDYDFALFKLVEFLNKGKNAPSGLVYRNGSEIIDTGKWEKIEDLDTLPFIDRDLTKWQLYGEAYLYNRAMYILSGRGCACANVTPGACSFCIWQFALWNTSFRLRSPKNVVEEIKTLVNKYRINEVFDDNESGAIWNKEWIKEFYDRLKSEDLIGKVRISSNARADALLDGEVCELLKKSGYRLLKVGLESGSEETLKKINKKETLADIIKGVKAAKDHGLNVFLTIMVGYPWESEEEVKKTYEVAKELMLYKTRCGDCLQASVIVTYPGTPLYTQSKKHNWFNKDPSDYPSYDMSEPLLTSKYDGPAWCNKIWSIHLRPKFVLKTILTIRSKNDIELLTRGVRSLLGHKKDFPEEC